MTRSDDPFGDLPEWKERRRLQEAQGHQLDGAAPQAPYPQSREHGYAPPPLYGNPGEPPGHAHQNYDDDFGRSLQPPQYYAQNPQHNEGVAAPTAGGPEQPYPGAQSPAHYDVHQQPHPDQVAYHGRPPAAPPLYDPQSQITYPADPSSVSASAYQGHTQPPPSYGGGAEAPGYDRYGLRDAQYDDGAYQAGGQYAEQPRAAPEYDLSHFTPGQPAAGGDVGADPFYDPHARHDAQWQAGKVAAGAVGAYAAAEDDDDEYYDDEDDEPGRYSWKLLAAVIVTGAVVTGGGVVLYDSFKGGGIGKGGAAPIIKAEQGPSKTAPVDAGGRTFGHRDSKLLGRLDNSGDSKTTRDIAADPDAANRVRTVPTVRIGRDGRLILPKAPEAVEAPTQVASTNTASSQGSIPGINVVESLNGRGLPSVVPQAEPPVASAPVAPRAAVPEVKPPTRRDAVAPRAPVIKNRGVAAPSTAKKIEPPPVPGKSAVGSAWRMTSTKSNAASSQDSSGNRALIAQPITVPASPATASTLGAGSVVKAQGRAYVAVLATAPTSVRALQSFAELQQKHPTALSDKVPSVQKADLKSRGLGIMYRLVVGPAGSRSAANALCASLKSEGYKGCWVKSN